MRIHDLLLQQVLLVEKEDDGGVLEPGICDDGPEQSFTLLHTILTRAEEDEEKNKHKIRTHSEEILLDSLNLGFIISGLMYRHYSNM